MTQAGPIVDPHPNAALPDEDKLLIVRELAVAFGGVKAVDGLTMSVLPGEIVSVIGPNGAGKTSAFNCITGFYKPDRGTIIFGGRTITGMRPSRITKMGMARTFQNIRLFTDMTVLDNVRTGMHTRFKQNVVDTVLHTPRYREFERRTIEAARGWLDFVGYRGEEDAFASQLPYGEQRRVEIARALGSEPRLLLLDEPGAGLNHGEKDELLRLIRRIQGLGVAIVLIEHDMGLVMEVSERVIVLNYGKEIADGTPAQVKANPLVVEAYLGVEEDEA